MKRLLCIFLLFQTLFCFSQEKTVNNSNLRGKYLGLGSGVSIGTVRDMLSSPLFYNSLHLHLSADYFSYGKNNVYDLSLKSYLGANVLYFDTVSTYLAYNPIIDLDFKYYRVLPVFDVDNLTTLLGVNISNSFGVRINPHLMNAAITIDNISNACLNLKGDWELFTKKRAKSFILSAKLGVPIVSVISRPRHTVPTSDSDMIGNIFEGYKFKTKFLSGLNTDLSASYVIKNGNRIKLSYYWDAFAVGDESNSYNSAKHLFLLTLVYKIK